MFCSYSGFEVRLCASYLAFQGLYIVFLSVLVFALFLNSFHNYWISTYCGFWVKTFRYFPEPGCTGFAFTALMVCGEVTYLLSIHMPSSLCSFHIGLSFSQMFSSFVLYSFQITKEWCRVISCYGNAIFSSDSWVKNGHVSHQGHEPWGEVQGWTSGKDTHVLKRNENKWVSFCFWTGVNDGVQNMLPQNWAPWHIKYFKLKDFEKTGTEKPIWSPPLNFSPETHDWRALIHLEQRNIIISATKWCSEGSRQQVSLSFPHFTAITSYSLTCYISIEWPTLH